LLYLLLIIPIIGIFLISTIDSFYFVPTLETNKNVDPYRLHTNNISNKKNNDNISIENKEDYSYYTSFYKKIAFVTTIINLIISLIIYLLFDFSNNQFQFIQENLDLSFYDIYLGVDGVSIYFVLLTTIIMPIALISN
jgi:NADH-ubiquinone oxidoreductase chain 4